MIQKTATGFFRGGLSSLDLCVELLHILVHFIGCLEHHERVLQDDLWREAEVEVERRCECDVTIAVEDATEVFELLVELVQGVQNRQVFDVVRYVRHGRGVELGVRRLFVEGDNHNGLSPRFSRFTRQKRYVRICLALFERHVAFSDERFE